MINKLGLVLECAREGADEKVFTCLIRRLSPATTLIPNCKGNKKELIRTGADTAKLLLDADKCDKVIIVWDLRPKWPNQTELLTAAEQIAALSASLTTLGIRSRVDLICINAMLETWVIADERSVSMYLSRPSYAYSFSRIADPEAHVDPKGLLTSAFANTFRKTYRDQPDAVRIIQHCPNTSRLKRVSSFALFVTKLTGSADTAFSKCGDVCNDLAPSGLFQPIVQATKPVLPVVLPPKRKAQPKRKARPRR